MTDRLIEVPKPNIHVTTGNTPYLYRPIAVFDGKVLKCCGIATVASRKIVQESAEGQGLVPDSTLLTNGVVVETPNYMGDRIHADGWGPFAAGGAV